MNLNSLFRKMTLGFILLESLNNLSTTFRFFLPRISTQFTSGNWLIIFLVLEMLLGRFDQTLFNFSFIHSIEREKSVYGCFYWFFCYWGLFLNNIFLISKNKMFEFNVFCRLQNLLLCFFKETKHTWPRKMSRIFSFHHVQTTRFLTCRENTFGKYFVHI